MASKSEKIVQAMDAYLDKVTKTTTLSGIPMKAVYTPEDMASIDYKRDIGNPSEFPYTRGIYPTGYRGKLWTRRGITGFGSATETNKRFKYQLAQGATGLSFIPDWPGEIGIDFDHPLAKGQVGITGVPMASLQNMRELYEGIPLDKVTTSIDSSVPAQCLAFLAWLLIAAEEQGVSPAQVGGTLESDPLQFCFCGDQATVEPLELSVKLVADIIEYCYKYVPRWNPMSIETYDMREWGISAPEEMAFALASCITYLDATLKRGLTIDEIAPRFTFVINVQMDIFEEAAKLRAYRRMWAKMMKDRYGAKEPRAWRLRFAAMTGGSSLVRQQPINNVIRVAYESLAAILGGCQSLDARPYDEPLSLPSEMGHTIALRTQQILAYETGAAAVVDPLGGSYYVENLTNQVEEEARKIMDEIENMGGMIEAIRTGWWQRRIDKASLQYQKDLENKERILVGVNDFIEEETDGSKPRPGDLVRVPIRAHRAQTAKMGRLEVKRLKELKKSRDQNKLRKAIDNLRRDASKGDLFNVMPAIMEASRAYATLGEIHGVIREARGADYDPLGVIRSPF